MNQYSQDMVNADVGNKYGIGVPHYKHNNTPLNVTIKPTLACPAMCDHCFARNKEFPSGSNVLDLEGWDRVFRELKSLGTQSISLSGGEPMMYENIFILARKAADHGFDVSLKTSGWFFNTREVIQRLVDSGVIAIHLSIDSPIPKVHDSLRQLEGLHERAVSSIKTILECKPDMLIDVRMILHKHTFRNVPEMIDLTKSSGASSLTIAHIEHDKGRRRFLLNSQEIAEFRNIIRPKIIEKLNDTAFQNDNLRNLCIKQINSLFSPKFANDDDYQEGIYWKDEIIRQHCTIPSSFMMIEGDGSVLPCNPVEYTRHPIMGNVHSKSLCEIWNSYVWKDFRHTKFEYCRQCVMNQSITLPFRQQTNTIQASYFFINNYGLLLRGDVCNSL